MKVKRGPIAFLSRKKRAARGERERERNGGNGGDEISVYISPIMFAMALYFVFMGMAYEFVCSLAAVMIHECAHAKAAKKLGYGLNVIKLMPYGAALCGSADITPKHEAIIAVIGPIVNLLIATLFAALWWLVPSSYMFTEAFCSCNIYIGVFNLLPVYPLDGGRIMLALLSCKLARSKAYKIMRIISFALAATVIALFVATAVLYAPNVCLFGIGLFVFASALIPDNRGRYRALFSLGSRRERLNKPLEVKHYAISDAAPIVEAFNALDPDRYTEFTVLDARLRPVFMIDEQSLIGAVKLRGYTGVIGSIEQNGIKK